MQVVVAMAWFSLGCGGRGLQRRQCTTTRNDKPRVRVEGSTGPNPVRYTSMCVRLPRSTRHVGRCKGPNAKQRQLLVTRFFPAEDIRPRYHAFLEALSSVAGYHHVYVGTNQSHPALKARSFKPKLVPVYPGRQSGESSRQPALLHSRSSLCCYHVLRRPPRATHCSQS